MGGVGAFLGCCVFFCLGWRLVLGAFWAQSGRQSARAPLHVDRRGVQDPKSMMMFEYVVPRDFLCYRSVMRAMTPQLLPRPMWFDRVDISPAPPPSIMALWAYYLCNSHPCHRPLLAPLCASTLPSPSHQQPSIPSDPSPIPTPLTPPNDPQ